MHHRNRPFQPPNHRGLQHILTKHEYESYQSFHMLTLYGVSLSKPRTTSATWPSLSATRSL